MSLDYTATRRGDPSPPVPRIAGVVSVLLVLGLTACASSAPPRENYYRLDVGHATASAYPAPILPGVLEVSRPDSDGVLADRALAYQLPDGAFARYSYDLWSNSPAELLQQALADRLRDLGAAEQVVTPEMRVPPQWMVRGRLSRFEYRPDSGKVFARLQLSVISARDGTLVLLNTYESEQPVPVPGPENAIRALDRAADDIFARFTADLGGVTIPPQRRP